MTQDTNGWSDPQRSDGRAARPDQVGIPTPSGRVVLVDPRVHRVDVVRRLLALGVSPRTLLTLLPDWERLVRAVVTGPVPDAADAPAG